VRGNPLGKVMERGLKFFLEGWIRGKKGPFNLERERNEGDRGSRFAHDMER